MTKKHLSSVNYYLLRHLQKMMYVVYVNIINNSNTELVIMHQQQNNEQNAIQKYILSKPIPEYKAQALCKKVQRNMCKFFYPFKQYYSQYLVEYIVAPKPTYLDKDPFQEKISLSINKQLQYFRGSSKDHMIGEQYLKDVLKQEMKDRGLVSNHQNKSLLFNNLFIYASGSELKSFFIQVENGHQEHQEFKQTKKEQKYKQKQVHKQFGELILQIQQYQSSGNLILIRCRYKLELFSVELDRQVAKIRLDQQITAVRKCQKADVIIIATYNQNQYRIYQWDVKGVPIDKKTSSEMDRDSSKLVLLRVCQSIYPIHSIIYLNCRQLIFGFSNKITIDDIRCSHSSTSAQTLKRVSQIGNDRFTSITPKCSAQGIAKNQLILARSKYIDIFDIRYSNQSYLSVRHLCQQAPPSCLLPFNWDSQALVVAYCPFQLGSSILVNLGVNFNQITNGKEQFASRIYQKVTNKATLLYDSGKYYHGLYPKSVTPARFSDGILRLIHIDSSDGICVEYLKRQNTKQFNIVHVQTTNMINTKYPEHPYKKWVQEKQIQPYLRMDKLLWWERPNQASQQSQSSSDTQQEQITNKKEQNEIFKRKNSYCSLDSFRQKIHGLVADDQIACRGANETNKQRQQTFGNSYQSTCTPNQQEQNWVDILKFAQKPKISSNRITEQLLEYLENSWKI